jgi:predicted nuclease of predicted toxin-antitoxin system
LPQSIANAKLVIELTNPFKLLIDEDLSPSIAQVISQKLGIEAVAVRDRGLINAEDQAVFEYAYKNDYIVVTANIRDFEQIARATEIHAGIIFICDGELIRAEQIEVVTLAAIALAEEMATGRDMINRVLYVEMDRSLRFEPMPS